MLLRHIHEEVRELYGCKDVSYVATLLYTDERKVICIMVGLLWAIVVVLVVLWLLGFIVLHVSSFFIHLLLVLALIVLLYNLFVGMRART